MIYTIHYLKNDKFVHDSIEASCARSAMIQARKVSRFVDVYLNNQFVAQSRGEDNIDQIDFG